MFLGLRRQLCSCVVSGVINALSLHSGRVEQGLPIPARLLHLSRPDESAVYFMIRILCSDVCSVSGRIYLGAFGSEEFRCYLACCKSACTHAYACLLS